ncbi:sensor histidine kinase, partial [Agrobacterium rhizogenes]|nr:sensor histidine kinase [Rhizobium rhizogenes]
LGLGLFIAKTLLERSGATVTFENLGSSKTGARVTIIWPRALMDDKRNR